LNSGERRAFRHYRLRGYRLLDANARVGRFELDLVLRRGRRLVFVEVKEKQGAAFGHPLEMIDAEKVWRVQTAARGWLAAHPELAGLEISLEAAAVSAGKVERVPLA
jgi:putative endonuclease